MSVQLQSCFCNLSVSLSLHFYSPGFWALFLVFQSTAEPVITFLQSWFLGFVSGLLVNLSLHFYSPGLYSHVFWSLFLVFQSTCHYTFTALVSGFCFWSFSQNLSLQSQFLVFQSTYNVSLHFYSPDLWSFSHPMPIHFAIPVSGLLTNIHVIAVSQSWSLVFRST